MADRVIDSFQGDYRWLSNFEPCEIAFEGILYPSTEHAYQAAKTLDRTTRAAIAAMNSPGKAKRAGAAVKSRPDWADVKLRIMEDILRQKFQQVRFRKLLMSTGDMQIVEGNTWGDVFWGVCGGVGENHLGRIIMKLRGEWMEGLTA